MPNNININEWLSLPAVKITAIILIAFLARSVILFAIGRGLGLILLFNPKQKENLEAPVKTLSQILSSVITVLIILVAAINILDILHFNTTAILTSAGVITLVAGIASQNLLKDLVSGISMLVDAKYQVGDCISVVGLKGEIIKLGLKTTTIRDSNDIVHLIPNSEIKTISKIEYDNASVSFVIEERENTQKIIEFIQNSLSKQEIPYLIDNNYSVIIKAFEINGVKLNISVKTYPLKAEIVEASLRPLILGILQANNVKLANFSGYINIGNKGKDNE